MKKKVFAILFLFILPLNNPALFSMKKENKNNQKNKNDEIDMQKHFLHAIVHNKEAKTIEYYLERGATINSQSPIIGETPFQFALMNKMEPKTIKFLLMKGASVSTIDKFGNTPLHTACKFHYAPEVIEHILNHTSFKKNILSLKNDEGQTPKDCLQANTLYKYSPKFKEFADKLIKKNLI